jgi:DNA-binding MarR family transcriptional regulator/predicted GNAT family N-acyltransferase
MDFYNQVGKMALGSRLRRLSELITDDAANVYRLYNIDMQPKWFPVFYVLSNSKEKTITEIANDIGHSHPSVIKIIGEMIKKGYVIAKNDKNDGRKNIVYLSKSGKDIIGKIQTQYKDVDSAIEAALKEANNNLWEAIKEWENLFRTKNLIQRVQEQKKLRESKNIKIVNFKPEHSKIFTRLNKEWISKYFKMEMPDYKALNNPEKHIIDKGGYIFVALYYDKPAGTCALMKSDNPLYDYELAKMAVSSKFQGNGLGWLLGKAAVDKAKSLGAKKIYLESNTLLEPAINLYRKLGFKEIAGVSSPYKRTNIQMVLTL